MNKSWIIQCHIVTDVSHGMVLFLSEAVAQHLVTLLAGVEYRTRRVDPIYLPPRYCKTGFSCTLKAATFRFPPTVASCSKSCGYALRRYFSTTDTGSDWRSVACWLRRWG